MAWDVPRGFIEAKHILEVDLEDMRTAQLERELIEHLRSLKTPTRRRAWLNRQLKESGLVAIRCPRNNARQQ